MNKRKYHVLIIPSWYPAFPGDIGGSFFREQAIALHQNSNQMGVIFPSIRSIKDINGLFTKPYGAESELDYGVYTLRNHYVNFAVGMPWLVHKNWLRIGLKLFKKYIQEKGMPDLIHVHSMLPAGFLAKKIKDKYGVPYVVTEHSTAYAAKTVSKTTLKNLKVVVDNSAKNIAVSNEFKCLLENIFNRSKWFFIPNMVNEIFFDTELKVISKEKITFVSVSLLTQKKRVDILIRSFANAFSGNSKAKLIIGGDGEEKKDLIKLTEALGINNQVEFLGELSRDDVKKAISKADAFILSSECETFGVVLVEALALGKPVIATKCGGPESIVIPEVGYLVEKNSIEKLTNTLLEFSVNKDKFKPEVIRKYCWNTFSKKAVVSKLEAVYQEAIKHI